MSWGRQSGQCGCPGPEGFLDTHRTAELVGDLAGIGAGDVAVCSTGLIGERLPTDRLFAGAHRCNRSLAQHGQHVHA